MEYQYTVISDSKPSSDDPSHAIDLVLGYDDILEIVTAFQFFVDTAQGFGRQVTDEHLVLAKHISNYSLGFYRERLDDFE